MDTYPFFKNTEKINVGRYYFAGLECIARVCKKKGVEMHIVVQSFGMTVRNKRRHVLPSERQMQYQKNVLIGFGVKQYSYFTYWTKQMNRSDGEFFPNGEAMMNRQGEKTKMWYRVQKINKELTELAPLLWEFDYRANAFFANKPFCIQPTFLEMARGGKLSQVKDVQVDRDVVLVTEQYDKKKKQYMYCVTNLLLDNRVNYICSADYQEGSDLDSLVKCIIQEMKLSHTLQLKQKQQRSRESKKAENK